ncbi:putative methyltransferase-domain-containing protein [Pisolithus sp. B1]|nr:putative methyltransferase-domain-containing protein [Pisolithus sp. B1]
MVAEKPSIIDASLLADEIALDETLDALDPLRHLRNQDDPSDHIVLVPTQPRSVQNQCISLTFPSPSPEGSVTAIRITLRLDASPGCGGMAWPAGEVLSNYIALRGEQYCRGKTILELGSGTGLVGLVAGALGGHVWITDQAPLLGIMQDNVIANNLQSSVTVAELNWGEKVPSHIPCPDLILAADCVYYEPAFPLLVKTLSDLSEEGTDILFCYKKRRKADKRFFALLKKQFNWREVPEPSTVGRVVLILHHTQDDDDPNRESYARAAISLLVLTKRTTIGCV